MENSKFIDKTLKHLGVDNVGAGIARMAGLITNHQTLEMVLAGESPEMRQAVYDAVRPHLCFKANPLDTYVSAAQQRAEREQLPTLDAKGEIHAFRPAADFSTVDHANKVLAYSLAKRRLTLTCRACLLEAQFYGLDGENQTAIVKRAREAGWVYDYKADPVKELCPACANG